MHNIWQGDIWIRLIHKVVQHDERLHDGRLDVVEFQPLLALQQLDLQARFAIARPLVYHLGPDKVHGLAGVHVVVGALDHGVLRVGLVLVDPELVLLAVVHDLGHIGDLGSKVDLCSFEDVTDFIQSYYTRVSTYWLWNQKSFEAG